MGANAQTSVPLFTAGEVLTAANQNISAGTGVPVFATTTTRDAAFGGTGEKTLAEGQTCYIEAAPKRLQVYNGTAWIDYDAQYTAFTPTFTSYTRGNGTTDSRYVRIGKMVHCYVSETLGSTSAITGNLFLTLPISARSVGAAGGSAYFLDSGAGVYPAVVYINGPTQCFIYASLANQTYVKEELLTASIPFTWTTNDRININLIYEAA